MALTADTIGVDIVARIDKLAEGLRKAEVMVDRTSQRMNEKQAKASGGFMAGGGKRLVAGAVTVAALDRSLRAANSEYDNIVKNIAAVQNGTKGVGRAWQDIAVGLNKHIPVLREIEQLMGRILTLPDGSAGWGKMDARQNWMDKRLANLQEFMAAAKSKTDAAAVDALGTDTIEGAQLQFQQQIDALKMEVDAMTKDAINFITDQNIEKEWLNKIQQYHANRTEALRRDMQRSVRGAPFDQFESIFGSFKKVNHGTPAGDPQKPANVDEQKKQTQAAQKTASILERMERSGASIVVFS